MKKSLMMLLIIVVHLPGISSAHPQTAASQKNLNSCLRGYSGCDLSQLTSDERIQVSNAAHQRNLNDCLHGYLGCNPSKLTDGERPQVEQPAHQRNFNDCLHGYLGCIPSKLTDAERLQVAQAARQRNFNNCLHGYLGCDASALSIDELAKIQSSKNENIAQANRAAIPRETPRYYTNKDGIRVQSPTHYDSRPAGATAQCADGTYSFSLNHRGTCSHHGGVSKWLDR